jgi:hypothetical protein
MSRWIWSRTVTLGRGLVGNERLDVPSQAMAVATLEEKWPVR